MARGNLLLGKAKGKLGSVVLAQANGELITRSKPESVKNPKSTGQNTQRAILATIAKSAAAMTKLVDHSFANVNYGAESVRHFRKINLGILRNLYLNTQNDANIVTKGGNFVPNPLKVSEGNLSPFIAIVDSDDIGFLQKEDSTLPAETDITVGTFLQSFPYLQGGDQITLVKINKINKGKLESGDAVFTMSLDRIVFAPNAFDTLNDVIITGNKGVIGQSFLDLTKTTNPECISVNPATGGLGFTSEGECYCAALILSRKVNGKWQRSTQYLEQIEFDDHTNNAAAIASYGATASVNAQNEYLNQADKSTGKKGVSGSYANFYSQINDTENDLTSLHAGETKSVNVTAAANSEILLACSGFGTADNPIVKTTIESESELLSTGQKYCECIVKATGETAGQYIGRVLFRDGTKAEITWNIAVQ